MKREELLSELKRVSVSLRAAATKAAQRAQDVDCPVPRTLEGLASGYMAAADILLGIVAREESS